MKLIEARPWFYFLIVRFIGTPPATAIYTYGDSIYAPGSKGRIAPDLWAHERVHWAQQGRTPYLWWARYLVDPRFRIAQEAEAYRVQVRSFPRSEQRMRARELAAMLSSSMYGKRIANADAWRAITEGI